MVLRAMAGTAFGMGMMCCVVAGKQYDQQMEQMRLHRQKKGEPKQIHFWNVEEIERFFLLEGGSLCMMAGDGAKEIGLCRFVEERQVDVNGQFWENEEFLWQMEYKRIQDYPLQTA